MPARPKVSPDPRRAGVKSPLRRTEHVRLHRNARIDPDFCRGAPRLRARRSSPSSGSRSGKGLAEFKRASDDLKQTIEDEIEQGKHEAAAVQAAGRRGRARSLDVGRRAARPRAPPRRAVPRTGAPAADPSRLSGFNPARAPRAGRRRAVRRPAEEDELPRMGFFEHLEELRKRLVVSIVAVFVGFLLAWNWAPRALRVPRPAGAPRPAARAEPRLHDADRALPDVLPGGAARRASSSPRRSSSGRSGSSSRRRSTAARSASGLRDVRSLLLPVGLRVRVLRGVPAGRGVSRRRRASPFRPSSRSTSTSRSRRR